MQMQQQVPDAQRILVGSPPDLVVGQARHGEIDLLDVLVKIAAEELLPGVTGPASERSRRRLAHVWNDTGKRTRADTRLSLTNVACRSSATVTQVKFFFRKWVTSTCRTALFWGLGIFVLLALLTLYFRQPGSGAPLGRAFGVLVFYGGLFLVTLTKIWWTAARKPAVILEDGLLGYQPLHTFRVRSIPLDQVRSCAMRPGTQSLRFVYELPSGREREFFLNLAVIDRRNELLYLLGQKLESLGLEPEPEAEAGWQLAE